MTFETPRPFFPYREPKSNEEGRTPRPRLLRVYFLSTGKVKGTLGERGDWPGKVAWANKLGEADREKVLKLAKMPADAPPAAWWLTEFEDHSSPRPGSADVYFAPAGNDDPEERQPHVQYVAAPLPADATWYALAVAVVVPGVWRRLARRKGGK
jgi:hypothetical protein